MCLLDSAKSSPAKGTPKKMKVEVYKLTGEQKSLIKADEANKKIWVEAKQSLALGPVRIHYFISHTWLGWANNDLSSFIFTSSQYTFGSHFQQYKS